MKFIVCECPGQFSVGTKEIPERRQGEALIRIKKVGICGTDLHAFAGNQAFFSYPRILGHELAAEVIEVDEGEQYVKVGDKVVVMPYLSCNECIACRNGKTNCCTNIKVLGVHTDGGMQEIISVPKEILIPSQRLSYAELALVEPLAIGAHAIRRAALKSGDFVVVVGCGPIGIGIMKFAQLIGAQVIAIDTNQERLNYVKEKIGIEHTVKAGDSTLKKIAEITNGDLAAVVFDATGHKKALELGVEYMSHGGKYILVGLSKGELIFTHPAIHAKETSILCSRNATFEDFKYVISILEKGEFPVDSFITHKVDHTEMIENFNEWLDPKSGVIKAMINF